MTTANLNNQPSVNNSSVALAEQQKLSEMSNVFSYEGNNVTMRLENGVVFVNLTEVAKAFPSKNLTQIVNSKEIQEYATKLATKLQIYSLADLVRVTRGGDGSHGTWAHQRVALRVAQKLSTDFAIWVDEKIEELLTTGRTSITQRIPTAKELALMVVKAEEEKERLMLENEERKRKIVKLEEDSRYLNQILNSKNAEIVSVIAQDYGMNAPEFNKLLNGFGIQYKKNGTWFLYSKYIKEGYVTSSLFTFPHSDGRIETKNTTKWTRKGMRFLYNKLKEHGILPLIERNTQNE